MHSSIARTLTLSVLAFMVSACSGYGTKDQTKIDLSAISFDGQRLAGIEQSFTGGCNSSSPFHPFQWCGDYDDTQYVKDHSFRLWVSGSPVVEVSSPVDEEVSGSFVADLPGDVQYMQYVVSDDFHYVLVGADELAFVDFGEPVTAGYHTVYQFDLSPAGQLIGEPKTLHRKFYQFCYQSFYAPVNVAASESGRWITLLHQNSCDAAAKIEIVSADTQEVVYEQGLVVGGQFSFLNGDWVTVVEGASDEELGAQWQSPLKVWDGEQGEQSLAKPVYRAALVDYLQGRALVVDAAAKTDVFVLQQGNAQGSSNRQIRVGASGDVTTAELDIAEAHGHGILPAEYDVAYHMDFERSLVIERDFSYYGDLSSVRENPELRGDQLFFFDATAYGYLFENGGMRFSRNFGTGGEPSDGELIDRYYDILRLDHTERSVVAELDRVERGTGNDWNMAETSVSSWAGLGAEDREARFLRFEWMFNAEHELLGCAATARELSAVEGAAMMRADTSTGCQGGPWRRMVIR
ncbi:MAG: hypothetical protein VX834_03625 [Myxococcota bacterium]|nr:hypothetical protein [Myxococcota bacterium]